MHSHSIFLFDSHCPRYGLKPNYCTLFKCYCEVRVIDFVTDFLIAILTNVCQHFTNNLSSQQSSQEFGREGQVVITNCVLTLIQNWSLLRLSLFCSKQCKVLKDILKKNPLYNTSYVQAQYPLSLYVLFLEPMPFFNSIKMSGLAKYLNSVLRWLWNIIPN